MDRSEGVELRRRGKSTHCSADKSDRLKAIGLHSESRANPYNEQCCFGARQTVSRALNGKS